MLWWLLSSFVARCMGVVHLPPLTCHRKMAAANKWQRRAQRRQRGRVICQKYFMAACIDQLLLTLRMCTPQHEHNIFLLVRNMLDDCVRQLLPTALGMAGRLAFFNRQASIEQQHAVFSPLDQTAAGHRKFGRWRAKVALDFLKDIAQGRRQGNAWRY